MLVGSSDLNPGKLNNGMRGDSIWGIVLLITVTRDSFKEMVWPSLGSVFSYLSNATEETTLSARDWISSIAVLFSRLGDDSHFAMTSSECWTPFSQTRAEARSLKHGAVIFLCRSQSSPFDLGVILVLIFQLAKKGKKALAFRDEQFLIQLTVSTL